MPSPRTHRRGSFLNSLFGENGIQNGSSSPNACIPACVISDSSRIDATGCATLAVCSRFEIAIIRRSPQGRMRAAGAQTRIKRSMPEVRPDANGPSQRLPVADLARGLAIVQMVVYHFIYDLSYFGWLHIEMTREPGWIAWRSAIVSQFLLVVGIGIGLGDATGRSRTRFWRRWLQISGAPALASIASAWLFGPRLIWVVILHFAALALLR